MPLAFIHFIHEGQHQPGVPTHPIYNPPPYPDQGLPGGQPGQPGGQPGVPTHPIYIEGTPSHPIVIPQPPPGSGGQPAHPIILPGDPSHPITLPPEIPGDGGGPMAMEWKAGWTQVTGWIVIGIPQMPHPTPSGAQGAPTRRS